MRIASVRPEEEKAVEERTHVADTFGKLGRVNAQLAAMFLSTESSHRDQHRLLRKWLQALTFELKYTSDSCTSGWYPKPPVAEY